MTISRKHGVHGLRLPLSVFLSSLALVACGDSDDSESASDGAPSLSFSATPDVVNSGGSTELMWSSAGASDCTASGGWSGSRSTSGSETISNIVETTSFSLVCSGAGGNSPRRTVTVEVSETPVPTLELTANPTIVAAGGSTELTWSSENTTGCTASGGWTGARGTSGVETIENIQNATTFTLVCDGPNGSSPSREVAVGILGQPQLTLTANPTTVVVGGDTALTWDSTDTTSCTASGAWAGAKPLDGNEVVGPLNATSTFILTCTGPGGQVSRNVTVTVNGSGASLSGSVDSSYVDRFGLNRIYVYPAASTPDDFDGDSGDPIATIEVSQDGNACTFSYDSDALADGDYTIAFTADAASDTLGVDDSLSFVGTQDITIGSGGASADFRPSGILTVGSGRMFATLRDAQLAATDGAVVEIDAGVYVDDVTVWRQNNVTLRAVGGRAHIQGNRVIPFVSGSDRDNGMGLMVIRGTGITVENFEFSNAEVTDLNGAGIRNQGRDLTICNGYFHDNQDGFLGEATGTLIFEYTEFARNGLGDPGFNHNVYVDGGDRLIFRHSYSHHTFIGHNLKTRARENFILYNRLMDEASGSSSYAIDVPNGGLTFVVGNLIQQGPQTDNSSMLNYGTEGLSGGAIHELYIINNTFVNDAGFGGFTQIQGGTSLIRGINNLFVGPGSQPGGQQTTNLLTASPGFVDRNNYDYRLTSTSPAIDAGTAPGSARGEDLAPVYQYLHPAMREIRMMEGTMDIGAYEFRP